MPVWRGPPKRGRLAFEIRELIVAGIVRPEDIQSDDAICSSKIAPARIAYGGRGQISDAQQPRYGQQVMDLLLPFQTFHRAPTSHRGPRRDAVECAASVSSPGGGRDRLWRSP